MNEEYVGESSVGPDWDDCARLHYGVWDHGTHRVAGYAKYSETHKGFMVYDAQAGWSLARKSYPSIAKLMLNEPFVTNAAGELMK